MKLKMPIFEGEDAHGWIYRMERYFGIQEIHGSVVGYGFVYGRSGLIMEGMFINGLKPELRAYVRVMQPEGLHHAMKLSISISIDENKTCKNVLWGGGLHRSTIKQITSKGDNFRRLTDSELQAKRAKGLCYRIDKKFTPCHCCPSQTLQVLLVDESDGSDEAAPEVQVKRCDPGTKID
ncbi:hypothetical protein Tco_0897784 [Tanacetum coccineum]